MWTLRNKTPYAAERNWIRDKRGIHWWLVAVQATFHVGPGGRLELADEQRPPWLGPEYRGEPGASSLRYDSCLMGLKPTTDVVLHGSAYAPNGRPATAVPVTLRVDAIQKQLIVFGDRVYYDGVTGLTTTRPQPFTRQPIIYESAFGGADLGDPEPSRQVLDERNPVGRGLGRKHNLVNTPAHTIEYPDGPPSRRGPAGFGPIDAAWLPRRAFAGTYDARWVNEKKPLAPDDFDPRFHLCAPADQQTAQPLRGGEPVGLGNLSVTGTVAFTLPRIQLQLHSWFGRHRTPHDPPRLAMVLIEPDESLLTMVWQSGLRVPLNDADFLDMTDIEEVRTA